ncbi:MAG: DUF6338 family protein [Candidatus Rokuibacteriota bacterium]
MPATLEALLILLVFIMPGFITVRTKQMLVPGVRKPDAVQTTLSSITVSLLYLPLWLVASRDLLLLQSRLTKVAEAPSVASVSLSDRAVFSFFALALLLPISMGILWAIGSWNDWYPRMAERIAPRVGLRAPTRGVGDDLWDKLWLNRLRQPWLTVYLKDGRVYVGRGVEFSLSAYGRDLVLGSDTKMFEGGEEKKDLATTAGECIWVPGSEVSSIDVHE